MTDPAIEAAQRQAEKSRLVSGLIIPSESTHEFGVLTAREALKPIRELHYPREGSVSAMYPDPLCNCGDDWPCDTAKLIYTTEEQAS